MAVNLKQNADGSMGLQGTDGDDGGFIVATYSWTPTSDADVSFFVANRKYRVKAIVARIDTVDGAATTATIRKAPSATAIASGTALHSSTINLNTGAATNQTLTLSTTSTDLDIAAGDCIGIDFSAAMTGAYGSVNVTLAPA